LLLISFRKEVEVENLDKCFIVFSKKHAMLVKRQLSDFYTIKLKKPFTDKNAYIHVTITVDQPHLIVVEPSSLFLDF